MDLRTPSHKDNQHAREAADTHGAKKEKRKTKSNSRSDRILTRFKESPGCVISKCLQWDSPQVIHKQLFCGDNRQARHIRSPVHERTQARTNNGISMHTPTQLQPCKHFHIHIQMGLFLSPFLPSQLSPSKTNTLNITHCLFAVCLARTKPLAFSLFLHFGSRLFFLESLPWKLFSV